MTALSNIVNVTVSKQTSAVARATYGIPAIMCEFLTSKTTTAFARHRYYGSMSELTADGWAAGDAIYDAANLMFGQAYKPNSIMVGRMDSTDATASAALAAINLANADWYGFAMVGITSGKVTLSADLITGNSIASTFDGVAVPAVVYGTSHAATMTAWKSAIELAIAGATATVSGQSITVTKAGRDISPVTCVVTLGASQPTATVTYVTDSAKTLSAASWAASNQKLFGHADANPDILNSGVSTDLPSLLKALSYERTFSIYHTLPHEYAQCAWMGLELTKVPGKSTWAEKVLQGVSADNLTEGNTSAAWAKNCSTFTTIGGKNVAVFGLLASGDPIEATRDLDYAVSEIQADLWALKLNNDKVPYNDSGIALEEGTLRGTGNRMEQAGIFVPGTFDVVAPKFANVATADIAAQTLTMTFSARRQNAIVKTTVNGTVTL